MLDNISHANTKIKTGYSAELGDNVSVAGVFPSEFTQLQLDYPIFFKKNGDTGQFEAVVLLGFESGENLFLKNGKFDADYVPLSIQRQPFLIGFQETVENGVPVKNPVVTIDMDHPRVNESEGEAVFLPGGGNSDYLNHVNSVLVTIHQGHEQRHSFIETLLKLELIESSSLAVTFSGGSSANLEGLYTINEDRLRTLPADAVVALHQQGYWQHIYMMLASIGNIRKLIARKDNAAA